MAGGSTKVHDCRQHPSSMDPPPMHENPLSEFKDPSADLILESSDGVRFRVHKTILRLASPWFRTLLSLPQPHEMEEADKDDDNPHGLPIIRQMPETSQVLDVILRICYPALPPVVTDLKVIGAVVAAASKYEIDVVLQTMQRALQNVKVDGTDDSLRLYALSCRYHLDESARRAALGFLSHPTPDIFFHELRDITGADYFRLMEYRRQAIKACQDLFLFNRRLSFTLGALTVPLPTTSCCALPVSHHAAIQCDICPSAYSISCYDEGNQRRSISNWWRNYQERATSALAKNPMADIFSLEFISLSYSTAQQCVRCRSEMYGRWAGIVGPLAVQRMDTLKRLPLNPPLGD